MTKTTKLLVGASLALSVLVTNASADVVVIVNVDNPLGKISKEDVKRIYLGKDTTFPDGQKVDPADQAEGSATRGKFYASVIEKSDAQVKAYWSQMIFTGKGTPPSVVGNDAAIKKWVAEHKDGIGYVDSSVADGSVKVLLRVP